MQDRGELSFRCFFVPCSLGDLGEGELEDFLEVDEDSVEMTLPRGSPVENGHVYLINQGHFRRYVLFKVTLEEE